jgi:oligosaccharyltransferase complex subunit delta (ribophorin II)
MWGSLRLSIARMPASPLKLSAKDRLKITFQVLDKDSGNGVQPHQTFLRFFDEESGEEGIQPIRVTSGGKVKFELVRSTNEFTNIFLPSVDCRT